MKLIKGLVATGLILAIGLITFALWPTKTPVLQGVANSPSAEINDLMVKGKYLAEAGDCAACHTAPGGKDFAGGLPLQTPIGTIYSTNISPDKDTGIGNYSLSDFERALRHGILPDGKTMYPAMPYPSYAKVTDEDVRALYVWFMKGVEPVSSPNRASDIPWPLSLRLPLAIWRKVFVPEYNKSEFNPSLYKTEELARGAYLVQGLGHCGSCHTPRAITLQEKALDDTGKEYLSGDQIIDGWLAVNLRGDHADGMGDWSEQDIVDTLRTGRNANHAVIGSPMADVVSKSTSKLTDSDLRSIATYIKSLPYVHTSKASFTAPSDTAAMLASGKNPSRGAELYVDNCSACHLTSGKGVPNVFPSIANNPSVLSDDPISVVDLILNGSRLPSVPDAPSDLAMPGFGWRLSDSDVADLSNFIRNSWGNHSAEVTAAEVHRVREEYPERDDKE